MPIDTRDSRVTWADEVVFNERPRKDRFRAISLKVENVTILKAVSLPLEREELPSLLRQEVDIICDTSFKTCVAEDVFVKIGLDEDKYWDLKDQRDLLDLQIAGVVQEDSEKQSIDDEAAEDGPWEGTPLCDSDDENLDQQPGYSTGKSDCDILMHKNIWPARVTLMVVFGT
jgi:hypothetical protein